MATTSAPPVTVRVGRLPAETPTLPPSTRRPVRVAVHGGDALTRCGIVGLLRGASDLRAVAEEDDDTADIAVVAVDTMSRQTLTLLRVLGSVPRLRVAVIVGDLSNEAVALAVQAGAVGLLRRRETTRESLWQLVRSVAAGDAVVPPDLLAALLPRRPASAATGETGMVPRLLALGGLNERELSVLRLLGEGADTREIAHRMVYSERTVKTIIQDVVRRFGLRNRTHAVAYAVRHGLI
jgi:DNA-binding NarL/FixJ family response regulator